MTRQIALAEPLIGDREVEYVLDAVRSGWVSSRGPYIERFERSFADLCGSRFAISTSNGTAALHLALVAAGFGPGDEVLVPALTFIACANSIAYCGATPVILDVQEETWCMDPQMLSESISPATKALMPVHLYGHPADMDPIMDMANERGIKVLEDGAEALGALYKGRPVGSIGDMGAFSFYGNKMVTTGEGGMVVTDDAGLAQRMDFLKNHGMHKEKPFATHYKHEDIGFNYRMTNLQAALGLAQLDRMDEAVKRKVEIAETYNSRLAKLEGVGLPPNEVWADSVFWMYSILIKPDFRLSRDELAAAAAARGIETRAFFYPLHLQPRYADGRSRPVSERLSAQGINLPCSFTMTDDDVHYVCDVIEDAANR